MVKRLWLMSFLIFALILTGCSGSKSELKTESEIVKIFKALDAKDFDAQAIANDKEKSDALLNEVYVEPELTIAKKVLADFRRDKVKYVMYERKYHSIDIVSQDDTSATLQVKASTKGDFISTSVPEKKLGPWSWDSDYKVVLKKVNDKWFISEVITKEEEQKSAEGK